MLHWLRLILTTLLIAMTAVLVSACVGSGGGPSTQSESPQSSASGGARVTVEEVINQVETDRPRDSDSAQGAFAGAQIGQDLIPGDGVKT